MSDKPAFMTLVVVGDNLPYNQISACYEDYMTIEDFVGCGWFLRKKVETLRTLNAKTKILKTVYTLEWHGNRACRRLPSKYWPKKGGSICSNLYCMEDHW